MTYTAKIRAKGLDATGVTEDLARKMYGTMGGTTLAIVELEHVERSDDSKGDHTVALTIGLCEPSLTDRMDDHLRELMRGMYADRRAAEGEALPGTMPEGRTLDQVLDAGESLLERDPLGGVTGTWDGDTEDPARHQGTHPVTEEQGGTPLPDELHPFVGGGDDPKRCNLEGCGKTNRAAVHITTGTALAAVPDET